jgi:hypothetical protein
MAMNPAAQSYTLSCGRDVETVWERLAEVEAGLADEHELTCAYCRDARESLVALREVTGELVGDTAEPSLDLTGRIMSAVRAEVRRRHDMVSLPTAEPGRAQVSEHAVAAVLRFAADGVAGVRARRCRVRAADIGSDGERVLEVELSVAVSYRGFVRGALDVVRERVSAAAATRIGPRLHHLDLIVEDVYDA